MDLDLVSSIYGMREFMVGDGECVCIQHFTRSNLHTISQRNLACVCRPSDRLFALTRLSFTLLHTYTSHSHLVSCETQSLTLSPVRSLTYFPVRCTNIYIYTYTVHTVRIFMRSHSRAPTFTHSVPSNSGGKHL